MIERLRRGEETSYDVSFYHHEANEAQMCKKFRNLPKEQALKKQKEIHDYLDAIQGGSVKDRYHPDVVQDNLDKF